MSNSSNNHLSDLNIHHLDNFHRELASLPGERSDLGYQHIELKKGMKLESLSINELRSQLDEIELLSRSLDIHVLTLNETKLDSKYPSELTSIPGYRQEQLDRTDLGESASSYIGDSIKCTLHSHVSTDDLEFICIEINPPKSKSCLVLAWYRPPNNLVSSFDKLEMVLLYLHSEGKEIILLGDTSCDLTAEQAWQPIDNDTRHVNCLYGLFSFNQLVREPTRVTVNSSSIIDHVATNCANNIIKPGGGVTSIGR